MSTPSAKNLLLGAGAWYFDRFDKDGKPTGERHLGNSESGTFQTTVDVVQKYSSMTAARELYAEAVKQIKGEGKVSLEEYDPENVALALYGESGLYNQTAQTAQAHTVTAFHDRWVKIPLFKIKNVVVADAVTTTTTYVEGTDYEVDYKVGRILAISTGNIANASQIKVTADCDAVKYPQISGGNTPRIEGYLRFVGDPTYGPAYMGDFWHVTISPDGELGFISEDFKSFGIKFACLSDRTNHPDEPLYRLINIV